MRAAWIALACVALSGCVKASPTPAVASDAALVRQCYNGEKIVLIDGADYFEKSGQIEGYSLEKIAPGTRLDDICKARP